MKIFGFLRKFKFWANAGKDVMTGDEIEHYQGKNSDGIDNIISLQPGLGIESDLLSSSVKTSLRNQYKNLLTKLKETDYKDATELKINFVLGPLKQSYLSVVENEEEAINEVNHVMARINNVVKNNLRNSIKSKNLTESEKKFNQDLLQRLTNLKYKKFVTNDEIDTSQEVLEENKNILMQYSAFKNKQNEFNSQNRLNAIKAELAIKNAKTKGIDLKQDKMVVEEIKEDLRYMNTLIARAQNGEDVSNEIKILKEKAKVLIQRYLPEQKFDMDDMELVNLVNKVLSDKEACLKQYQSQVDEQTAKKIVEQEYDKELANLNNFTKIKM